MCCKDKNIYETFNKCCKEKKKESCGCSIKLPVECIRWTSKDTDFAKENENLENILKKLYNMLLTEEYIEKIVQNEKFQEYLEANYYKK